MNPEAARQANLENILSSKSRLRVIVAGPGTGKTFTFGKIVAQVSGPVLALTFLTNLAEDLQKSLGQRVDARTFHGYAKQLLHAHPVTGVGSDVDYFPAFLELVAEDFAILGEQVSKDRIEAAFLNLQDDALISRVIERGNYFNAVSHTDSVYRVFSALRDHRMAVPTYAQILVDEYQDFCRLEASLIDLLALASPILIVGDDDQALYAFKHASPEYIREKAQDPQYVRFELPYCTRCTAVLVEATHLVVAEAQQHKLLQGRVPKQYLCYMPEKAADSEAYPKVIHAHCTVEINRAPYLSRYVIQQIQNIPQTEFDRNNEKNEPTVLVIGPRQFITRAYEALIAEGRSDVELRLSQTSEITLLDAYRRLARNPDSRLGWRILLHLDQVPTLPEVVRATTKGTEIVQQLSHGYRESNLKIAELVGRIMRGEVLTEEEWTILTERLNLTKVAIEEALSPSDEETIQSPNILVTSLSGSKGLQADYVFVLGVNEGHFPRDNGSVSETEVCQLLVALTRAKKQCTLVSLDRFGLSPVRRSVFIDWLRPLIREVRVDRHYW